MAKCRARRIVASAEVRLSIDTIIKGGSAERCVADSPRKPAGPSGDCALTIVLPVARRPIAPQKARASMVLGASLVTRSIPARADLGRAGARLGVGRRRDQAETLSWAPAPWTSTRHLGLNDVMRPLRPFVLAFVAAALAAAPAAAQDWPNRPVRIVVPNGPGGITDVLARLTADRLAKMFGQPFVVDNRGGAGGVIGTEFAARAPNDGHT